MAWRDTKAGLLLFITSKHVTAAIEKAHDMLSAHDNFKELGKHDTQEWFDVVMRSATDPDRMIKLALLPFALRTS